MCVKVFLHSIGWVKGVGARRGCPGTEDGVCFVMRKLNSDPASGNVYISSPAPGSVNRGYHKIRGGVKRNVPTATSGGWGKTDEIEEMTIDKLAYQFGKSLPFNDFRKR
jgi:hypothetical protein